MSSPVKTEISSLVSLIANAARSIESYYAANGENAPSLNDIDPHPLDDAPCPSDIQHAVRTIEGACLQLCATVARPGHTILNRFTSLQQPTSIGVVLRSRVADALSNEPGGLPISELGKRTGVEEKKLGRVLRLLCSQHIFREVSKDVFANNRLSIQLLASNPISNFGYHSTVKPVPKISSWLADTLLDPESGHSYAEADSAFSRAFGYKDSIYSFFEGGGGEEGAKMGARFGKGMIGWNKVTEVDRVTTDFPWAELPQGTIVNDVAGGVGDISIKLCKQHPNLICKLQDLPERINQAKTEVWPAQCPEAIADGRIEFKAFDMVNGLPLTNCDIYFMKHIIHNYSDHSAIKILNNVAKVMSPTSRLLIHECIIRGTYRVPENEAEYEQAPEPLLPNFGAGGIRQYDIDVLMMAVFNGQERTLSEHKQLAEAAGLRFVKLWDLGEMGIIEFALAG